jgi:hypothetical protein
MLYDYGLLKSVDTTVKDNCVGYLHLDCLKNGNNIEIKQTKDEIIVLEVSKKVIQRIPKSAAEICMKIK